MSWKSLAKRTNSLPEGWSTPDEIAADLDCEISEVPKILASALREGLVEKQNFPCWTPGSRQLLYQTGYRQRPAGTKSSPEPKSSRPADELTAARHPDKPAHRIIAYLPPRLRGGVTSAQVNALLDNHPQNRR
jgi:hypothetical protein